LNTKEKQRSLESTAGSVVSTVRCELSKWDLEHPNQGIDLRFTCAIACWAGPSEVDTRVNTIKAAIMENPPFFRAKFRMGRVFTVTVQIIFERESAVEPCRNALSSDAFARDELKRTASHILRKAEERQCVRRLQFKEERCVHGPEQDVAQRGWLLRTK
jgi:hypothetical protein